MRVGVLEGDVQGCIDADRLAALHVPVTQLNTDNGFGGECHLDANMVRSALPAICRSTRSTCCVIENVGNLVCPAEFRVGEDARVDGLRRSPRARTSRSSTRSCSAPASW